MRQTPSLHGAKAGKRATAVAFWTLLALTNGFGLWLRIASNDVGPLDMRVDFSPEHVWSSLAAYEESRTIDIYRLLFIPVDYLFIVSYAIAGSALARRLQPKVKFLVWLPVAVGIADALENFTVLWMLNNGPSGWSFPGLTIFTLVKDLGLVTYLGWLSLFGIRTIVAKVAGRTVQSP